MELKTISDFALLQCILQANSESGYLLPILHCLLAFFTTSSGAEMVGVFNALIFPGKTLTTAMLQDVTVTIVSDEP